MDIAPTPASTQTSGTAPALAAPDAAAAAGVPGRWRDVARAANLLDAAGTVAPTVFATMSALAARTGAINLGQGFPDTDGPQSLLEDAVAAVRGGVNQYPPGRGIPVLREAIAEHQRRFYGLDVDPETEVLVTAGATEALAAALLALVSPGDEVVVLEPYYDAYAASIELAGATRRTVPLRFPEYTLEPGALAAAVGPRTRLILLNSPHNPTVTCSARPSWPRWRGSPGARPAGADRRGVRAPGLRRTPSCAAGDAARHGRAHSHDLERRQDLLRDRLEDRLDPRPG